VISFRVDDVAPATTALPTRPLHELFPEALAVGGDPALPVLVPDGVHPLLDAVGRAFADHRPLVLSPDAVWLTITQGLAQHVRLHAEELRPRLVGRPGRKRLMIELDGPVPADAGSWGDLVATFDKLLAAEISDAELFACDFSTSTEVERTAGRIVMLDAYSSYFSLWVTFVCGIPSITLTGTPADWRKIRTRVDTIAGFGLEQWCRSLAPITEHFVRAAEGAADVAFWQRIYSPADAYGGDVITGWVTRLYPYLRGDNIQDRPNPLLELPVGEPRELTVDGRGYDGPGIRSDSVPATLSRVVVTVNDPISGDNRAVALHAGLAGVAQDPDGALRPVAGWYLTPAAVEIDDVIDRIVRDHETEPPEPDPVRPGPVLHASADVVALYRRLSAAMLFGGSWRVLPVAEHRSIWRSDGLRTITTIIDLTDGRSIGSAVDYATQAEHWVVCRVEQTGSDEEYPEYGLADDPAEIPVLGTSLALLLDAALDAGGDLTHLETGRLAALDG
jgi:hypothetical protein